jgi:hypothetical protein
MHLNDYILAYYTFKDLISKLGMVVHPCNASYSGG